MDLLAKADMTVADIVKITQYLTRAEDIKAYAEVRTRFLGCVIRLKAATDSDAIRPPIPTEVGHPFRLKPAALVRPV